MKTKVRVAYSVTHVNTVTVTVTDGDNTAVYAQKCSSANIKATIVKAKAAAVDRLAQIEQALA